MGIPFKSNIDLNQNKLLNSKFEAVTDLPANGSVGQFCFYKQGLWVHDGISWKLQSSDTLHIAIKQSDTTKNLYFLSDKDTLVTALGQHLFIKFDFSNSVEGNTYIHIGDRGQVITNLVAESISTNSIAEFILTGTDSSPALQLVGSISSSPGPGPGPGSRSFISMGWIKFIYNPI